LFGINKSDSDRHREREIPWSREFPLVLVPLQAGEVSARRAPAGRRGETDIDPKHFAERLIAGMPDAIVYADAEGVIRFWNRGATRIFGFAEADALGQSLDIIIPERLRARHWEGFRTTMRTGQSRYGAGQMLAVPAIRKDGTPISVEFTIVPFTGESGQMIGIAAIMRDTTARFEELHTLRRQFASLAPKPEP
jgi:PAS domain S-box-containing protein